MIATREFCADETAERAELAGSGCGDSLSALLRPCRIACAQARSWRLAAPWSLDFKGDGGSFVVVREGACVLRGAGSTGDTPLAPGDVAVCQVDRGFELFQPAETGPGGMTRLWWAGFAVDDDYTRQTFALLPALLVARGSGPSEVAGWRALLDALPDDLEETRPGGRLVRDLMLQALLACVLRAAAPHLPDAEGLIAALRVPGLGRALGAIHADPRRDWSVAELAEVADMSRSSFSEEFSQMLRRPPFEYLRQVRMQLACRLLAETSLGIKEIAAQAGYSNKASFSKAFGAAHGCAPSAYRRHQYASR